VSAAPSATNDATNDQTTRAVRFRGAGGLEVIELGRTARVV
jgi:hypothetical protein